jgi:putative protease
MAELLAPAGSFETLVSAVRCGADAVYIGGKSFSARHNASNFTMNEVKEAVYLCHLNGVKLHIAVNTIVFDSQLEEFANDIKQYAEMGVDALIVQDIGAFECIKKTVPDIPVHASTQLTVHTVNGALTAKELGFERIVLSRELSYRQIEEISRLDIETEVFVHGALCMSVSGQCYMSALIGSRSANRGLCAQPCRLPFSAVGNRDFHALSLKDSCLAYHMQELINAGVDSFKIEGRMKRPEYVASAVNEYRKAIDGLEPDTDILKSVFSRSGFTDGYYTGKRNDMFGTRVREDVVSAEDVFPKIHQLYRKERKCADVNFSISLNPDEPAEVQISDSDGNNACVTGDIPCKAIKRPADREILEKQFSKLGDTVYSMKSLEFENKRCLTLPASSLNDLRRKAVSALDIIRAEKNTPSYTINNDFTVSFSEKKKLKNQTLRIKIKNLNQLSELTPEIYSHIEYIYIPMKEAEKLLNISDEIKDKTIIIPPRFTMNENSIEKCIKNLFNQGFKGLACNNISYIHTGKKYGFRLHGDFGLNIVNSYSLNKFSEIGLSDAILSPELKINQIYPLSGNIPSGIIAYGRLPLMLVKNCPVKNETGCKNCTKSLTDRTGRKSPVICCEEYAEIFNSSPVYMADRINELKGIDFLVLSFTDEPAEKVFSLINEYISGSPSCPENITRGLLYRGII